MSALSKEQQQELDAKRKAIEALVLDYYLTLKKYGLFCERDDFDFNASLEPHGWDSDNWYNSNCW